MHDRLGSVRALVDTAGFTVNNYTYNPYGQDITSEIYEDAALDNPLKFTAQFCDAEIGQYYLRARQYDPHITRFTGRDLHAGQFEDPLTLHKYMYCFNNPTNGIDLTGLSTLTITVGGQANIMVAGVMVQGGFAFDSHGNISFIGTAGTGAGLPPSAWAGVAVGVTNADTVFDLRGDGAQIGGSATLWGRNFGVEKLFGFDDEGAMTYTGWEFNPGGGFPPWWAEFHVFGTSTIVSEPQGNWLEAFEIYRRMHNDGASNVKTLGQGYMHLLMSDVLDNVSDGDFSYIDRMTENMDRFERLGLY